MKTNPIVAKTETVEVFRTVKLSLNKPSIVEMTAADAVKQRMFETSNGTMDVAVTIKTGPYAGCQAYLDGVHVRARTEYAE